MPGREDIFQKAMNDGHSAAWDQEWDKAAAAYRRALQEFPDHPKALNSLGLALYQLGNVDEALQIYINVSKISPDDPVPVEKVAQLSERTGDLKTAVEAAMRAGDLFLKQRDTEKALENWVRVTNLNPEHAIAHSRLAQVHEKLGHLQQAVVEYLAIASIIQRAGNAEKTKEMVNKALSLLPNSPEVKQAQTLLSTGQLLPKPMRGKGGTGPIRMAQVKQLQQPQSSRASGLDPVAEARQKALTQLAELLFEYSDDSPSAQERRGISAIMKGTGGLSCKIPNKPKQYCISDSPLTRRPKVMKHKPPKKWNTPSKPDSNIHPFISRSDFYASKASGLKAPNASCKTPSNIMITHLAHVCCWVNYM
ncbi:MAG: tetratricopeptide repeat protein [Anaerolineales bacterium]|nr:tetratricopeptide repeat protein [Anaerolineales bacterium]